jgi:hypothetical protein
MSSDETEGSRSEWFDCLTGDTSSLLLPGFVRLVLGQREDEDTAPAHFRLDADAAAVQVDNLLHCRQTESCALTATGGRGRLEYLEDAAEVFGLDAGTVVGDAEFPEVAVVTGADAHLALWLVDVLDGIADEILKDLRQACAFSRDGRQGIVDVDLDMVRGGDLR